MSMIPYFPSLRPRIANPIWFDNSPVNEEAEILRYERDHHNWLESFKNAASDIPPLGKVLTMPGLETDDEDANDDSDDTDSHEEEDDETNERAATGLEDVYDPPGDEVNDGIRNTVG